jgi:hypothetical protein
MAVVAAVMMWLSKRRGREQQHQGQDNQLLHAAILPRISRRSSVEITIGTFSVSPCTHPAKTTSQVQGSVESRKRFVSSKGIRFFIYDNIGLEPQTLFL